jgi:hypothetical protein
MRVIRFLLLGLGATAAIAVAAFLPWLDDRSPGDIPIQALWGDGGGDPDFTGSLALVLLVLAGVALVATFVAAGWLLAIDGIVVLAVVVAWYFQAGRDGDVRVGVWVATAGGLCALLPYLLGRRTRAKTKT